MTESAQYYKKICEFVKNNANIKKDNSSAQKALQEAYDMYELLK